MPDPRITHLVDETTTVGVMRQLDQRINLPRSTTLSRQTISVVKSRAFSHGKFRADVIVSHLSIRWRSLPALMALRAIHPNAILVHIEHSPTTGFTTRSVVREKRQFSLLQVAYSLFDRVVALSKNQGRWLSENSLVEKGSLTVAPNSANLDGIIKVVATP